MTTDPPDLPELLPELPELPELPALPSDLPALPSLGQVTRRPPTGGARRRWQAARVIGLRDETAAARTFRCALAPGAERHVPGQHYDVRLTAEDGSTAQRSYSIASAPGPATGGPVEFELTVEKIADGDVSPYLHDVVRVGDDLDVRGPFGGWFIWRGDTPVLLVGGGSGVVPLMAMRRHWAATGRSAPLRLLVSVRTPEDLFYAGEYGEETTVIYTRQAPAGHGRPPGRLDGDVLAPLIAGSTSAGATAYVCGSAGFAEHASQLLVHLGIGASAVRVERFGPT